MLKWIIANNYRNIIRDTMAFTKMQSEKSLHNSYRIMQNRNILDQSTFEGYDRCGPMTYTTAHLLYKNGYYNLKLMLSQSGYGKYKEDHVHLLVDDKHIVDPTYRQIFGEFVEKDPTLLSDYLYRIMPPMFVGTNEELITMINNLRKLTNNKDQVWSDIYDEWLNLEDVSHRLHNKY